MVWSILLNFLTQAGYTIGAIFLCGFLIALFNRGFYSNFGSFGGPLCYITGFIGTPVHECSHALFCLIFGHQITDMQLFQISSDDGTLGYVEHAYNRRNIYHRIGNFFIGVAPILVISVLLYFLSSWLTPGMVSRLMVTDFSDGFFAGVGNMFSTLGIYVGTWQFWVYVVLAIFLSLHMTLSGADIRGSMDGLAFLLMPLLIVDVILGLVDMKLLTSFTDKVKDLASFFLPFLAFGVIVTALVWLVSFILSRVFKLHRI